MNECDRGRPTLQECSESSAVCGGYPGRCRTRVSWHNQGENRPERPQLILPCPAWGRGGCGGRPGYGKNRILQIEDTWCLKVSLLSKVTPKVLSESVIWTLAPATSTDLSGGSVRLRWWVLSQMASDLSGFKASPFTQNHSWSLDRQRSRRATDIYWSDEVSEMKRWLSSAY